MCFNISPVDILMVVLESDRKFSNGVKVIAVLSKL